MATYYDHPFTITDPDNIVSLDGYARFWADGSDTDVYYQHPMTGQDCERIEQALAGFSEQDEIREAAWRALVEAHQGNEGFLADLDPPSLDYIRALVDCSACE